MTAAKTVPISNSAGQVHRETVMLIPVDDIRVAPWNARKSFDAVGLAELVASIREHGIQVPLLIRDPSTGDVGVVFEIVCGHRRFEAAKQLGLSVVPCIERLLTDDQAREIGLVDNLQREDVPALEEGTAYGELLKHLGSTQAIAARVGKDVAYVARRLQLVSLAEMARKALAERLITVDHALLLARLGADEQDENLKWALSPNAGVKEKLADVLTERIKDRDAKSGYRYYEAQSVLELKKHIEQSVGRRLSIAPWNLEDAELVPAAGACATCPSNTKANDLLFGDMSIAAATCANGECFEQKREAFVEIRLRKANVEQDSPELGSAIKLSWKTTTVKPRAAKGLLDADGFNSTQTFKYGQWIDAKKRSCEYIRLGVTVDWDEPSYGSEAKLKKPGQILTVCIAEKCKVHKKTYTDSKQKSNGGNRHDPEAEAKEKELRELLEKTETPIREKVWTAILGSLNTADAVRVAADGVWQGAVIRKDILKRVPTASGELLEALVLVWNKFDRFVEPNGYVMAQKGGVSSNRKALWDLAKRAGVNADKIAAAHFHEKGSIAPAADPLYPKGIPWPKGDKLAAPAAGKTAGASSSSGSSPASKKPAAKPAKKKVAKKAAKKGGRK